MTPTQLTLVFNTLLVGALLAVCWTDIRSRQIPNPLVAFILALGVLRAAEDGSAVRAVALSASGVLVGAGLLGWQYRRGLIGAGDVKLLAALGAWTGPVGVLWLFLVSSLLGGVVAVATWVRLPQEQRQRVAGNVMAAAQFQGFQTSSQGVPYGVSIALGALVVIVAGLPFGGFWP